MNSLKLIKYLLGFIFVSIVVMMIITVYLYIK